MCAESLYRLTFMRLPIIGDTVKQRGIALSYWSVVERGQKSHVAMD